MNLSFRQLVTFREVMRGGSISQAARTVGRTQPAVSSLIATLEAELGFSLFLREHGKLTPTPEAHYLLEETEAVLARLDRTKQTLTRIGTLETGKLRIACHPAASGFFIPRLLTKFAKDKPEVELALTMRSSALIEDLIASQQYDIGFAETPKPRASINQIDFDLECVCIVPRDDPLAACEVITPELLDGKPMAVLFDEHITATQLEAAFLAAGSRLNKYLELRTFLPSLQFVSEGLCYVVSDMITAYSFLLRTPGVSPLALRRFAHRISNGVSILTPGYSMPALTTNSFIDVLSDAVDQMQREVDVALSQDFR